MLILKPLSLLIRFETLLFLISQVCEIYLRLTIYYFFFEKFFRGKWLPPGPILKSAFRDSFYVPFFL